MTEPVREPKLIAPTRHIHAIWESNNPVVPEGVLCITKDRLYTGSVEYFIGDGTNPYTMLPKFGMNSQEGTASDAVAGMIELATPEEVLAGTDTERGITPATLTAKILGTVSEVEGVPTGAVIESGTNANGTYIKFADGTMECYLNQTVTDQAISVAYGSLFTGTRFWDFPCEFSVAPVVINQAKWGTGASWTTVAPPTTTSCGMIFLDTNSHPTGTAMTIVSFAIGRWY